MVPPKLRGVNPLGTRNGKKRSNDVEKESSRAKRRKKDEPSLDSEDEIEDPEREEFVNIMKSLFQATCKLYRLTKLHKIVGVENFARYERRLVLALNEKCKYQNSKNDWAYQVNIKKYNHVKRRDEDGETIYFQVCRRSLKLENRTESVEWKTILRGLITCRNSIKVVSAHSQVSNSPVLVITGPESVFSAIREELADIFSCYIINLKSMSSLNLKIIFGRWLIYSRKKDVLKTNTKVDLEFCVHNEGKLITYEASVPVWYFENSIRIDERASTKSIMKMWFQVFEWLDQKWVSSNFNTSISKIKSPVMRIAKEGVIRAKVNTEESVFELIASLTRLVENWTGTSHEDKTS